MDHTKNTKHMPHKSKQREPSLLLSDKTFYEN